MKKVLVLLENDMYVRNFLTSGALDDLIARGDVGLAISERVTALLDAVPVEHLVGRYTRSDANVRTVYTANKLSMLAQSEKSRTFEIKATAGWMGAYSAGERRFVYERGLDGIRDALLVRLERNPTLEAIIERERPDLVIAPFTGVEATPTELAQLAPRHGFRTLLLVNGWDNLSSKGVFLTRPDYLGAFGPQSAVDAVEIQGMAPHRVLLMGCARYEPYFRAASEMPAPIDGPYAVFAGCSLECDELTPLHAIDRVLRARDSNLRVLYRPHPWRAPRACDDVFRPDAFTHVRLDPQVEASYYAAKENGTESVSSSSYPSLDYYPALLRNAAFVVSTLSSLIVEAGIFDVPALLLAHDDGVHAISARDIARFRHFDGAEDVPGWHHVYALDELEGAFAEMLARYVSGGDARVSRPPVRAAIRHYLHWDERAYGRRLLDAARQILVLPISSRAHADAAMEPARLVVD